MPDQIVAANEPVVRGGDVDDVVAAGVVEDITFRLGSEVLVFLAYSMWAGTPRGTNTFM